MGYDSSQTYRPLNGCHDCGYEWHPRGSNRSLKCPGCGSRNTFKYVYEENKPGCLTYIAAGAIGIVIVFGGLSLLSKIFDKPNTSPKMTSPVASLQLKEVNEVIEEKYDGPCITENFKPCN